MRRNFVTVLVMMSLLLAAMLAMTVVHAVMAVPSQEQIDSLTQGMTKDQVAAVLGEPAKKTAYGDNGFEFWAYSSLFRWTHAKLYFDPEGRLSSAELDD